MGSSCISIKSYHPNSSQNNSNPKGGHSTIEKEDKKIPSQVINLKKDDQNRPYSNPLLICQSCQNNFNVNEFIPKNLPCGHTICSICILNMKDQNGYVSCPFDKSIFENDSFPTSLPIIELLNNEGIPQSINKNEVIEKKSMKRDEFRSMAYEETKKILSTTRCIITEKSKNEKYIKSIVESISNVFKKNFKEYCFSVKVFLFSKIFNYTLEGVPYLPINDNNFFYINDCKYEDSNWICHIYIFGWYLTERSFIKREGAINSFDFLSEDLKYMIIDEIKKAISSKKYFNYDEACSELKSFLSSLISNLKTFLINYCFTVECVFKNKTEGFLLAKEEDYLYKGIDGTIWISENINQFYSFFLFVTVLKIY